MTPRERLFALEQHGIKLGLDNITTLVSALGRPDQAYPSMHIAGTNGKGSVAAMVERGLREAGYRTGRYTSPHLSMVEERVALDGAPCHATLFDEVTGNVLALVDDLTAAGLLPHSPTFFEVTTAIAFEIFKRANVSAAVIEVGLGGRFDATNVISPRVTAITSIDFDHERHLGATLEQIAFEKAGIIKSGIPVVTGRMADGPRAIIANVARSRGAPVIDALPDDSGVPIRLGLAGAHQRFNAAVAVAMLKLWNAGDADARQLPSIEREAIVAALSDVQWPARMEWLRLPNGGLVLLDAAHNPSGARVLAEYLLAEGPPVPVIFGVMQDKEVAAMLRQLAPATSRLVAVAVDSPRAMPARELAARIREILPSLPCETSDDAERAVYALCAEGSAAVVAGSIFLVGPLRARLLARGAAPVRYSSKATPFYLN